MTYKTETIWPPFKGKAYKVVDGTGKGVGLYRTLEGARRKARAMNIAACTGIVHAPDVPPVAEYTSPAVVPEPVDHFKGCARCGQVVITRQDPPICQTCRKLDREPQGEAMRLFAPAPTQIPGQLAL